LIKNFLIIRNSAFEGYFGLDVADNRPHLSAVVETTVDSPQLVQIDFKLFFLWLLVGKRIIRKTKSSDIKPSRHETLLNFAIGKIEGEHIFF
jgi:hypothetical protein